MIGRERCKPNLARARYEAIDDRFFKALRNFAHPAYPEQAPFSELIDYEWVKGKPERRALGVDLDPEPLAWGAEHLATELSERARERVTLMRADARGVAGPKADVVAAQNFDADVITYLMVVAIIGFVILFPVAGELGKRQALAAEGTSVPVT